MSKNMFQKATRTKARLRLGLEGPAGSGKSYTALRIGMALLAKGERLAMIDTERGSGLLYADDDNPDGGEFDFDHLDLSEWRGKYSPANYIKAIKAAADAGYPVLIIDGISHGWEGEGGVLDIVDKAASRSRGNSYVAWREGTPAQNSLVDAFLSYPGHVICTLRTKVEYVLEEDSRGKKVPKKVGMKPIQREGMDYEFTVVGDLEVHTNKLIIGKTRCSDLAGGVFDKAGADVAEILLEWLNKGGDAAEPKSDVIPPWSSGERDAFTSAVSVEIATHDVDGITYGDFFAFMRSLGDDPETCGSKKRETWLGRLKVEAKWKKFEAWVHEGDSDDGGEG